jgi:hypothetical protein
MSMCRSAVAALLFLAATVSGCKDAQCPAVKDDFDSCGSGYFIEFDPWDERASDFRPFPNPLKTMKQPFKSGTTGYSPDYGGTFGDLLNTLDGFGAYAPVVLKVNDAIDPVYLPQTPLESLDPASPVFLVDYEVIRADPSAPFASVVQPVTAWYNREQADVAIDALIIAPYEPLEPKHEYAVVVTTGLQTWTDPLHAQPVRCVGPSEQFNCVKAGSEVDPVLEEMRSGLKDLFDWLESQGYERGEISMALNYMTESVEDELVDIQRQVRAAPAPKPKISMLDCADVDPTVSPVPPCVFAKVSDPATHKLKTDVQDFFQELFPDDQDIDVDFDDYEFEALGTIIYGSFPSHEYRHPVADAFITDGVSGRVKEQGETDLEFMVVLPRPDLARGIAPPYKTVVFQHALTVCKESMVVIANEFNKRGVALIGIDVVRHGSRSEESLTGERACTIEGLEFLLPDGNPLAGRDGFRQTIADQMHLIRMVKDPAFKIDVAPQDGVSDLDVTRLAYVSQSLGSIIGGTFVSLDPDIGAAVLNVGGGGLYSVAFSFFSSDGAPVGPDGFARMPEPFLDLFLVIQNALERADPINYAKFAARKPHSIDGVLNSPKNILLQEAIDDGVVGNYSTDSLTRAFGGELAGPTFFRAVDGLSVRNAPFSGNVAGGSATIAMTQFSPADHSFLLTLDDPGAFCRGQVQAAEFVRSYLETGTATVIDAYTAPEAALCPP